MRNTGMLMIASLLLAPAVHAAPVCEDAAGVARAFFEATSGDDGRVLDAPATLVSPAFNKALRAERACQVREEGICTIDSDPWLDAQDGDIDSPVRYSWKPASATAGDVTLSYSVWKEARVTRLPMVRKGTGCWQVDDVITHSGQSVRRILAQPVP
ncbi:hypothetical protein [Stenotrophomonas sp. S41]|uniref:hypothetical protein n=1 Tax=Stenotrophomonas sp. S41 TaxID=2767464 RepID=UPI00190D2DAB|nr:hypothetical protein [Stenotrophomonas sp. S41]MBK0014582.1 hypothetical protein [Stenotrophomonas sp. S41]